VNRIFLIIGIGVIFLSACGQGKITYSGGIENEAVSTTEDPEKTKATQMMEVQTSETSDETERDTISKISPEANCRVKTPQQVGYTVLPRPDDSDHSRGPKDSYVTIIEYGDFQ
jgi:hypothetical protein